MRGVDLAYARPMKTSLAMVSLLAACGGGGGGGAVALADLGTQLSDVMCAKAFTCCTQAELSALFGSTTTHHHDDAVRDVSVGGPRRVHDPAIPGIGRRRPRDVRRQRCGRVSRRVLERHVRAVHGRRGGYGRTAGLHRVPGRPVSRPAAAARRTTSAPPAIARASSAARLRWTVTAWQSRRWARRATASARPGCIARSRP